MYLEIAYIIIGIILLMFGRKLFFVFAGMSAFLIGFEYADLFFSARNEKTAMIVLAFIVQKVGLSISGFLSGGYVSTMIVKELGFKINWLPWVIFLLGGILGVVLVSVIFEWALIILSSLVGAFLIIQTTDFSLYWVKILFVLLASVGIVTQVIQYRKNE